MERSAQRNLSAIAAIAANLVGIVIFDIDGVVRDVGNSYRRALADTVEHFTHGAYRPSPEDIDALKSEGAWNNDWEASLELVYRYFEAQGQPSRPRLSATEKNILLHDLPNTEYGKLVAFFQARYRGPDPTHWTGYICQEPLLMQAAYLDQLAEAGIRSGFFSGATTGSARYVLQHRLGLVDPVLVAMEDAPGKPDPTGLLETVRRLDAQPDTPVLYVGDTVADMYTVANARQVQPDRAWYAVGVLPPHVQTRRDRADAYTKTLIEAGAQAVFPTVQDLTPTEVSNVIRTQIV